MMTRKLLLFLINTLLLFHCQLLSQDSLYSLKIVSPHNFELFINNHYCKIDKELDTTLIMDSYTVEANLIETFPVKTVFKKKLLLNRNTLIELNNTYPLLVRTNPDNARVYIDSLFFGFTPLRLNLLFKPKVLILEKAGYKSIYRNIENDSLYNFYIELQKIGSTQNTHDYKVYKYLALSAVIINGIFSTYYKQLANKHFYKDNRTQDDLNYVRKYDKLSAVFTIGMQLSFGIFVYLIFQE